MRSVRALVIIISDVGGRSLGASPWRLSKKNLPNIGLVPD